MDLYPTSKSERVRTFARYILPGITLLRTMRLSRKATWSNAMNVVAQMTVDTAGKLALFILHELLESVTS